MAGNLPQNAVANKLVKAKKARNTKKAVPVPHPSSPDLLAALPAELRNNIYELALVNDKPQSVRDRKYKRNTEWQEPGLLRTSWQFRMEALSMYYKTNKFDIRIEITEDGFTNALAWLSKTIREIGRKPTFTDVRLHVFGAVWPNLDQFGVLAEFLRTTGMKVAVVTTKQDDTESMEKEIVEWQKKGYSLFVMLKAKKGPCFEAVEDILAMGEYANMGNWSPVYLEGVVEESVNAFTGSGKGRKAVTTYYREKQGRS